MAHKKAAGSAKNLRDSKPKYRGVKLFGGQVAKAGNIILRQKGSKYVCGTNTYMGRDFSIHAGIDGIVTFGKTMVEKFNGRKYDKTTVSVLHSDVAPEVKPVVKKEKVAVEKSEKVPSVKKTTKKITKKTTKKPTK